MHIDRRSPAVPPIVSRVVVRTAERTLNHLSRISVRCNPIPQLPLQPYPTVSVATRTVCVYPVVAGVGLLWQAEQLDLSHASAHDSDSEAGIVRQLALSSGVSAADAGIVRQLAVGAPVRHANTWNECAPFECDAMHIAAA